MIDNWSIEELEFNKVKNNVSSYIHSTIGQKILNNLKPSSDVNTIKRNLSETKDAVNLLNQNFELPISNFNDLTFELNRLSKKAYLNNEELLHLKDFLNLLNKFKYFFESVNKNNIVLFSLSYYHEHLIFFSNLLKKLNNCLDDRGNIKDEASDTLKLVRNKISSLKLRLSDFIDKVIKKNKSYLTEINYTKRNGYYVIPVKSEYRGKINGTIIDKSQSGQTLYIEPLELEKLRENLHSLKLTEKNEELKILNQLSEIFFPYVKDLKLDLQIIGKLDFINAKAKYALALNAIEPEISDCVKLKSVWHPLIDKNKAISNDIVLDNHKKIMIITGPNTGGKTITLKTLGLNQLMAQSGLFITAKYDSKIKVFDNIFSDIGDDQSIEASLSTFSAHIKKIINIINKSSNNSLILLDELGSGTDPKEGASLAISILQYLNKLNSMVLATTHYSEVKVYGIDSPNVINASMEFNENTFQPTYKLLIGIPGQSEALSIASKLGLNKDIIENAKSLLDDDQKNVNHTINRLVHQTKFFKDATNRLMKTLNCSEELLKNITVIFNQLNKQKNNLINEAKIKANEIVKKTKLKSDQLISQARQVNKNGLNEKSIIDIQTGLNNLRQNPNYFENDKIRLNDNTNNKFQIGDSVLVIPYNQEGTLLEKVNDDVWKLQLGSLKTKINIKDLRLIKSTNNEFTKHDLKFSSKVTTLGKSKLDLRGFRYDEAIHKLDKFIDSALLNNLEVVTIVHGKGSGILRKAVSNYLNEKKLKHEFAPINEGGDGATIVYLK